MSLPGRVRPTRRYLAVVIAAAPSPSGGRPPSPTPDALSKRTATAISSSQAEEKRDCSARVEPRLADLYAVGSWVLLEAKTAAECVKAGGIWNAATNICTAKKM